MKFGSKEDYKFSLETDVICNDNEGDRSKTRPRVGWQGHDEVKANISNSMIEMKVFLLEN